MKFSSTTLLAVLSSLTATVSAGCSFEGGNYYCSETKKVIYKGIGFSGSYMDVTNMDENTGKCTQQLYSFSGNLSPLDEELSVHFRGPLTLLQFGVYYPSSSGNSKRQIDDQDCNVKHVHHKHKRATEVVQVTQTVFVDGNGNTVTSQALQTSTVESSPAVSSAAAANDNANSGSGSGSSAGFGSGYGSVSALDGEGKAYRSDISTKSAPTSTSAQPSSSETASVDGAWTRDSYYTPGSTDNCVFLNYHGGSGSGVWSAKFGNSLSYANADNSGGSSTPVPLEETTIKSGEEYIIFSGSKCGSSSDCGYYRKGTVAYHGFKGASKIFVFEFEMPSDTNGNGYNQDMPAVWLLNAKIPRTLQYGEATCSCWKTGCGELDLFEVLSSGSNKMISHLHDGQGSSQNSNNGGGGSQDYFERPTSGTFKGVVIFYGDEIHILQVDDETEFGSSLDEETVNAWLNEAGSVATIGY